MVVWLISLESEYKIIHYAYIRLIDLSLNYFRPADIYHTCYTLSGLSIAQNFGSTQPPLVIGNADNEVLPTHPLYNIPPKSVIKSYIYAQENSKESPEELISGETTETETATETESTPRSSEEKSSNIDDE